MRRKKIRGAKLTEQIKVIKGDSTNSYRVGVQGVTTLDANWECEINVQDKNGQDVGINRAVTDTVTVNGRDFFIVQLLPTETATLAEGSSYFWGIEVRNPSLTPNAYAREQHINVTILKQRV